MPAFSRGLSLKPKHFFSTPPSVSCYFLQTPRPALPRSFTTSQLFRHATKKAARNSPKQLPSTVKKPLAPQVNYQSFADSLASRANKTLLYVAPSHTLYIAISYSITAFCYTYAGYTFKNFYLDPPPGLNALVPPAFVVIAAGMAFLGTWVVRNPSQLIKSITAIPASLTNVSGTEAATAKGASLGGRGPLMLEIEVRKTLPFLTPKRILVKPEDCLLERRIFVPPLDPRKSAAEQRLKMETAQAEERRKSIWWRPFRDARRAFSGLFVIMRTVWVGDGFLSLATDGAKYKLDVTGGWALDEGRALDRLVRLKSLR